jgi:hypothetical protein
MYFFIVLFVIDLKLWPFLGLKYLLAILVLLLSLIRIAYYASLIFLRKTVDLLSSEKKRSVLDAHERREPARIESILSEDLGLKSAAEVTRYLLRTNRPILVHKFLRLQ